MTEARTLTLAEFLLARIADEEDVIRSAQGTPARTGWQLWTNLKSTTPGGEELGPRGSIEMSPERALAELHAKQRLVKCAASWKGELTGRTDLDDGHGDAVLRVIAQVYRDHPDFNAHDWLI